MDETVVEMTDSLSTNINAELGAEVVKASARAGYARSLSNEKKTQYQQRARKYVDSALLAELAQAIDGLSDYMINNPEKYYILIDKLDESWIDQSVKFQLIQALFEALKSLRKIRNLKVVAALRTDVYEKTIQEALPSASQIEKNEDYIVRIRWTKEQLKTLAETRINYLFRRKYSKENVHLSDVIPERLDSRILSWPYILERTLYRPRDVIYFINFALRNSEGKTSVSKTTFINSEREYSFNRKVALVQEWQSIFPGAEVYLAMLNNKPPLWNLSEICTSRLTDDLFSNLGENERLQKDSLWIQLMQSLDTGKSIDPFEYARELCHRLYIMGALGLKVNAESPWQWFYLNHRSVPAESIDFNSKISIHPMLHSSLHSVNRTGDPRLRN